MSAPDVQYLVVHTAASAIKNVDADMIDRWHRNRGWNGIGYHYVIINDRHDDKPDGKIEVARPENVIGAHAKGLNSLSLGICCAGHGDHDEFTPRQKERLIALLCQLSTKHGVPVNRIIGHREINDLVDAHVISDQHATSKTCPGNKVDMDQIRAAVSAAKAVGPAPADPSAASISGVPSENERLRAAILLVDEYVRNLANAQDEWRAFRHHPEVLVLINEE